MDEDILFQKAQEALAEGNRIKARDLTTRLLKQTKENAEYWFLMSALVESRKEQVFCLQQALKRDPDHRGARRGLVWFGALPPDEVTPAPVPAARWQVQVAEEAEKAPAPLSVKRWQMAAMGIVGLLAVAMLWMGLFGSSSRAWIPFRRRLTITPIFPTRTPTTVPSATITPPFTPTPPRRSPTPLAMLLDATYTPTPLYVNTPHPISEAYLSGLRAFQRGDMEKARLFWEQVVQADPEAADVWYYLGETYRLEGKASDALKMYARAIESNPEFAPAYLGRARVSLEKAPGPKTLDDLEQAIALDPALNEAYLELARYYLLEDARPEAAEAITQTLSLFPESPLPYLYRAQLALRNGNAGAALEAAQEAHQRDETLLPAYLVLGKAYLLNDEPRDAVQSLDTYTRFVPDDAQGWLALAQALYATGKHERAAEAVQQALDLDDTLVDAYLLRGNLALEVDDPEEAVEAFVQARRLERNSFEASFGLARAFYAQERFAEANTQFKASSKLAQNDAELGKVYYWQAQTQEALERFGDAEATWEALLALPKADVPPEWRTEAIEHLRILRATPTPTLTNTPVPTRTPSPTPTLTATSAGTVEP